MTRFPSDTPGASVLTGGAPAAAPQGDPVALALHARYRAACEASARSEAGETLETDPEGECNDVRWALEHEIAATPGVSMQMIAVKLMAAFAGIRAPEWGKPDVYTEWGVLELRSLRDAVAAAAGLEVLDPEAMARERCVAIGKGWNFGRWKTAA